MPHSEKKSIEDAIKRFFPMGQAVKKPLYDIILPTGELVEVKKQTNQQWFDMGKYCELTDTEKQITMFFICTEQPPSKRKPKKEELAFALPLGEFLRLVVGNPDNAKYGWSESTFKKVHDLKKQCPKLQQKAQLYIRKFFEKELSEMEQQKYIRFPIPSVDIEKKN